MSKNPGILEAIKEVRVMGLGRVLKALYDDHLKQIRDQNARDDYVREEGIRKGRELQLIQMIQRKLQKGKTPAEIAEDLDEPLENVERICRAINGCNSKEVSEIYEFMNK